MRITSSSMHFGAAAGASQSSTVSTRLETWGASPRPERAERASVSVASQHPAVQVETGAPSEDTRAEEGSPAALRRLLVERLLAHSRIDTVRVSADQPSHSLAAPATSARPRSVSGSAEAGGSGAELTQTRTVIREEGYAFAARGEVRTADGRALRLELEVAAVRREVVSASTTWSVGAPRPKDPLVLSKTGATLDPRHLVSFDLDGDGEAESMAALGEGAAFLAIDRDGDGAIGDGTELFGPTSQDGFAELRALDADGSGWVDEGDAAWSALRVFRPGEAPRTLREANVGALAVEHLDTPFRLTGGAIAASSVYLEEDGGAGVVQHVDLNV
jgi:hypothetical protein